MSDHPEPERFGRAMREAIDLVNAGDHPHVAADYVAEEHDLAHRYEDIRNQIREAIEPDTYYVAETGLVLHSDHDCIALGTWRPATMEEIHELRECRVCRHADVPDLEVHGGEADV